MAPVANRLKLTGTVRGRGKRAQRAEKNLPAQRFFFARLGKLLASKKTSPMPNRLHRFAIQIGKGSNCRIISSLAAFLPS